VTPLSRAPAGQLISGAATSGQAKGAVTGFAENVLMKEQFVKLTELDVSYWAYWLSTCGYSSQVSIPSAHKLQAWVVRKPGRRVWKQELLLRSKTTLCGRCATAQQQAELGVSMPYRSKCRFPT